MVKMTRHAKYESHSTVQRSIQRSKQTQRQTVRNNTFPHTLAVKTAIEITKCLDLIYPWIDTDIWEIYPLS